MHVLAVDAPADADPAEGLAADLDGRVAVVREDARAGDDTTHVALGPDGWTGAGPDATLDEALDALAADHDYALLDGFADAAVPRLLVGGTDPDATCVAREALDSAAVDEALADTDERESLASLVADVRGAPGAEYGGALATFTGVVRERDHPDDARTERLEYERYDAVAADRLDAIRAGLEAREGVHAVRLHHRVGAVPAGEDTVYVVVLAGHRDEAFAAVADGVDRLKADVPIFKREVTVEGAEWAHDR